MTRVFRILVTALAILLAPATRAGDYETVEVPFGTPAQSLKEAGKAVKWTLLERRWRVDKESETSIQATLDRPDDKTWLTVLITFDQTKANISYVTSEMPGTNPPGAGSWAAPKRVPIGTSKYEGWVQNLAKDIPIYLQRLQVILS